MADNTSRDATEEKALVDAFNSHFKTTASPEAVRRLLGSPHVRGWYSEYRQERARERGLPEDWAAAGLTADEWAAAQSARALRREARAEASRLLAAEAGKYDAAVARINASASEALRRAATPMALALEGGYEQLPLAAQIGVESAADPEARAKRLKAELLSARRSWVESARKGEDPF